MKNIVLVRKQLFFEYKNTIIFLIVGALISILHINVFYYSHDTPKWVVFDVFLSICSLFCLRRRHVLSFSYIGGLVLILLYFMLLSLVWSPHKVAGLELTLRFSLTFLFGYCLIIDVSASRLLRLLMIAVFVSAFAFSIVFIIEHYVIKAPYNVGNFSPIGFMNNAGQVFNIWVPVLVAYCFHVMNKKILTLSVIILLLIVHVLMEAATRATIVGLMLSELIVFFIVLVQTRSFKQSIRFILINILLLSSCLAYSFLNISGTDRMYDKLISFTDSQTYKGMGSRYDMFVNTWEMAKDNPLGVGVNNFEYIHPKYAFPGTDRASPMVSEKVILRTPHNIILKMYSELGVIGGTFFALLLMCLFLCAFCNALKGEFYDKWLLIATMSTLFHSLLSAVFLTPVSLFFSIILFAVILKRFYINFNVRFKFTVKIPRSVCVLLLLVPAISLSWMASEFYAFRGQLRQDISDIKLSLKFNPSNDRALYNLSQIRWYRFKDAKGSLKNIDEFLLLYPYHISGLMIKAERQWLLKDYIGANYTLSKLLSFYPKFDRARRLHFMVNQYLRKAT
ncbi:O-antigen ligase family protein [Zooshikella harenae]|uniref:O-antigen ligase family protein n=1 Tax=Zooshikella harenae TaxID=2827238 RepID=A0ABS5ZDQ8_9GAMM|nr:O-antigen ligase family protein [Zooshikella harenae]MBU2712204.1 O-antigen ligase family protein [Zooshikella harenae]